MGKIYLFYLNSHYYGFGRIFNVQNLTDDNSNFNKYKKNCLLIRGKTDTVH